MWHEGSRASPEERAATASGFVAAAIVHSDTGRAKLCSTCRADVRAAAEHADGWISSRARNAVWVRSQSTDAGASGIRRSSRFRSANALRSGPTDGDPLRATIGSDVLSEETEAAR